MISQRFNIKQAANKSVRVQYQPTFLAPGLETKVFVELDSQKTGPISTEFLIATRLRVYKIPVYGTVLSQEQFDKLSGEQLSRRPANVRAMQPDKSWENTTTSDLQLPRIPGAHGLINVQQDVGIA